MKRLLTHTAPDILRYLLLCMGTFLMLKIITEHLDFGSTTGFLQFKQDYISIDAWRIAFYVHVFTSILTLLAGFTQFSALIIKEYKPLHRIMGRIYVVSILLVNFPSGMILAVYANGLFPARMAFIILDSLWFIFTLKAYTEIKKGNIQQHKRYMMRSYALTLSAITLRTWKLILSNTFTIDPLSLYMIDAWMGFVPNLLFAEYLIRRKKFTGK